MTRVWGTLAAIHLVALTGPDGQVILINPPEVVTVRTVRATDHHPPKTQCLIHTADGKFIAVRETCAEVNRRLAE